MTESREPERLVRRFARETNLLIAGRPFAVRGENAPALHDLLARLGGIPSPSPAPGRVEFDLDAGTTLLDGATLPERGDAAGRIGFARMHMPVARAMADRLDLSGLRVGVAMVLEPKTAVLSLLLRERGAEVSVYAHPDETDVAVAEELRSRGFSVTADPDLSGDAERVAALAFLRAGIDVLLDDGAHLIRLAHEDDPALLDGWIGACEETTSGLTPLRRMQHAGILRIPVMAVNDARMKTMFDNRYGTGQSCVFAIADLLEERGIALTDQPALVLGYGPVGQGVAAHLRAFGVEVRVAETDPVRALEARHDGFVTGPAVTLASGALVVSATGVPATVTPDIAAVARAIAVAGGVPGEVVPLARPSSGPGAILDGALSGAGAPGAVSLTSAKCSPDGLPGGHLAQVSGEGVGAEGAVSLTSAECSADAVSGGHLAQVRGEGVGAEGVVSLTSAKCSPDGAPGGHMAQVSGDAGEKGAGAALLLGGGGAVNITAAEGNPIEIMDLSFSVQLAALGELLARRPGPGVHAISSEVDDLVARTALAVRGAAIDPPRALDVDGLDDWRSPRYRGGDG
ncbi:MULTISPECIES: adenosylhomocysteinase [Microbacterium]|uniref:adenosylhomocysteinase n=1 Tax=Microbacterium TaxID=33882 RepID=UPI0027804DE8|nr:MULTISPECIES: adenosylhomocysteinase [Microbacterium]MDQ1082281.1 S-adenosylhomocysteine hydrolase [Microbacterium sp. SORGH_AS_0344]MDQ1168947.1 S-adenosylhomocysteine hydrolase [Microbacterium proteolyticum]